MISKILKQMRIEQNVSREQLSRGICSLKALEKIENRHTEIEKLLADALLQRLGKSMDKFDVMLNDEEYALALTRMQLNHAVDRNDFIEADRLLHWYREQKFADQPLHRQFLAVQQAEILRRQEAPLQEQRQVVLDGLSETMDEFEEGKPAAKPIILRKYRFCVLEMMLLIRYVILSKEDKKVNTGKWYTELLRYFEQIPYDEADRSKLYPFTAYHYACYEIEQKHIANAEKVIAQAIDYIKKVHAEESRTAVYLCLLEKQMLLSQELEKQDTPRFRCYQIVKEELQISTQDAYPQYTEYYLHTFRDILRTRRLSRGMTMERFIEADGEDVAEEICDVTTVSRIENAKNYPQKRTRDKILRQLGLSTLKYDAVVCSTDFRAYKNAYQIAYYYYEGKYQDAKNLMEKLTTSLDMSYITNQQFVGYWKIMLQYRLDGNKHERNKKLIEILLKTLPVYNKGWADGCILLKYERKILIQLGRDIYRDDTGFEQIYQMTVELYQRYQEKSERDLFLQEDIIAIYYNMAWLERNNKKYTIAMTYAIEGLKKSKEYRKFAYTSRLLYQQYLVGKDITDIDGADSCLMIIKKAYAISRLFNDTIMCEFIMQRVVEHFGQEIVDKMRQLCHVT